MYYAITNFFGILVFAGMSIITRYWGIMASSFASFPFPLCGNRDVLIFSRNYSGDISDVSRNVTFFILSLGHAGNTERVCSPISKVFLSAGFFAGAKAGAYTLFLFAMLFSVQAQMLLSEIQNSTKFALPYLTKRCLKYYLGREQ